MERSTRIVEEGLSLGNDLGSALHKISNVVTAKSTNSPVSLAPQPREQSVRLFANRFKATGRLTEITQEINSCRRRTGVRRSSRRPRHGQDARARAAIRIEFHRAFRGQAEQMLKLSRNLLDSMDRFVLDGAAQASFAP